MAHILLQLLLLVVGASLLCGGASYFVDGAASLARRVGVSQLVVGVTVVALGTSLPEFFVSLVALIKGSSGISVGNVVGSNICNISLILGLSSLFGNLPCDRDAFRFEVPLMVLSAALMWLFASNGVVGRIEGAVFLLALAGFIYYFAFVVKRVPEEESVELHRFPPVVSLVGGLAALLVGSEVFVRAAVEIARVLGVSETVIGLSLVALGTSLPELASSVAAVVKGKGDMAVGNVVGSNILNILFIIGPLALAKGVPVDPRLVSLDIPLMFLLSLYLLVILKFKGGVGRIAGLSLLAVYIAYIGALYVRGRF